MKNVLSFKKFSLKAVLMGFIVLFGTFSLIPNNMIYASNSKSGKSSLAIGGELAIECSNLNEENLDAYKNELELREERLNEIYGLFVLYKQKLNSLNNNLNSYGDSVHKYKSNVDEYADNLSNLYKNEGSGDSVPSFDGWQNSLNSNFLNPRTYTLSPDSSQENLKESQTNNDDKTDIPENDYDKELNPENIIVDDILKNWNLF